MNAGLNASQGLVFFLSSFLKAYFTLKLIACMLTSPISSASKETRDVCMQVMKSREQNSK